jgi:galactosamine-6-phosphate isomerase
MRIAEFEEIDQMGQEAFSIVMDEIEHNPQLLLCAATGSSPLPLYRNLAEEAKKRAVLFEHLRILPLDEWVGLPSFDGSCHEFLQKHILRHLKVTQERYFPFNPRAQDLEEECLRIQAMVKEQGPIDLCIMGLGKNGHLGFNEPAIELRPHCHIAELTTESQQHSMILGSSIKPTQGITLGMQDILSSKRIILIVSGSGKDEAKKQLLSGEITCECPASLLWKHNNVDCLVVAKNS